MKLKEKIKEYWLEIAICSVIAVLVALLVAMAVKGLGSKVLTPKDWLATASWIVLLGADILILAAAVHQRVREHRLDAFTNELMRDKRAADECYKKSLQYHNAAINQVLEEFSKTTTSTDEAAYHFGDILNEEAEDDE